MSGLPLVSFPFDGAGLRAVVTTRVGGASTGAYGDLNLGDHVGDDHDTVVRNRTLVARTLGVETLTVPDQQHGAACAVVTPELAGRGHTGVADAVDAFPATDALVTDVPGVAVAIMVADCAPVVLWDPVHRAVGVAHAGRPGVLRGVLGSTVARMREAYDTDPGELLAGIGPCVGFDSYEVRDADAEPLERLHPGCGLTRPTRPGHRLFDLGGAVERQLADLGIPAGSVHRMAVDTRARADTFFSDRAQRPCGRFAAVVVLGG